MTIHDFAKQFCPSVLESRGSKQLYDIIKERDDFPYDEIMVTEEGGMSKVVFIDDTRYIDVYELIAYSQTDVEAMKDPELLQVYNNYMEQLDLRDVSILDTIGLAKEWVAQRDKERADAGLLC